MTERKAVANSVPYLRGAVLSIDYEPSGSDPRGPDVHWIQVIYTNEPSDFQKAHGADLGNGFYVCIDDEGNPASNPFYDYMGKGAGNPMGFIDTPARSPMPYGVFEAETYTVTGTPTGDPATTKLEIENGVRWGFTFVDQASLPEPSTLVLAGTATMVGLAAAGRHRMLAGRRPRVKCAAIWRGFYEAIRRRA